MAEGLGGVTFLGRVEAERVSELCASADVFLNASIVDNQPLSLLEAFASGLPVVAATAQASPPWCAAGSAAWSFLPGWGRHGRGGPRTPERRPTQREAPPQRSRGGLAVAERQHEGDDAARHAEPLDHFHRARQRRFARGGREGDDRRLLDRLMNLRIGTRKISATGSSTTRMNAARAR